MAVYGRPTRLLPLIDLIEANDMLHDYNQGVAEAMNGR